MIEETLSSLIQKQNRKPNEIVIVNGGGKNNCKNVLNKWKNKYSFIKIIETNNINLSASRNIGLPKCSGDLILQTDDDARPYPDWIERIIAAHLFYKNVGVIGGEVLDNNSHNFLSKIADIVTFPKYDKICNVRSVPGVNSSYKREVVEQIGEYDQNLFRGEDVDYNWRVKNLGWKILYIPEIKVRHIHRSTWIDLLSQHYMYGKANYLVRKKWPNMYAPYPLSIDSIYLLMKYIASWLWFPFKDAYYKSKKMNHNINGFEFLTILIINLANRIGISMQKNFG